ncbi:MAG: hypothetical protein FJW34_06115 [Acidobacteria bacterium]|nr:hypothetical protein [Acidobacteriota bacterium]
MAFEIPAICHVCPHYKLLEKLGEGGMGVVWKARDVRLNRLVALKLLPAAQHANEDLRRRLIQEARAAALLNHPSIVAIYDVVQHQEVCCVAMEYVSGQPLSALVRGKPLELAEALGYAIQIAEALAAAHRAGIVHRDLKPGNIIVGETGQLKVLDFGLAKLTRTEPASSEDVTRTAGPLTERGAVLGTVGYMAPEQAEGKPVDARADIFSFGSLLYEMLTGRRAFQRQSAVATLAAILTEEPPSLPGTNPGIPPELDRIVKRCLRKDPARRFQDMDDVKVALLEMKEELESSAAGGVGERRSGRAVPRWLAWASAGVFVAALASGAWWWYLRHQSPPARLLPVTSMPGHESQPALSPDGQQVAFVWTGENGANPDIYVKAVGAANQLRLTTDPATDHSPAWSPSGVQIAFLRNSPGGAAVWLTTPFGGAERRLCQLPGSARGLSWSPDGKLLAYSGADSPQDRQVIHLLPLDTCVPLKITTPAAEFAGDTDPVYSPDDRSLAFARQSVTTPGEVFVLPLGPDGRPKGQPRRLIAAGQFLSGLAWIRGGDALLFSAYREGSQALWKVSASGGDQPQRVSIAGDRAYQPTMALHAGRLVFRRFVQDSDIWRIPMPGSANGGARPAEAATRLITSTWLDDSPQYSPDGRRIAFISNRSGSYEIWGCQQDGSGCNQWTSIGGPHVGSPRWSPDGRWIVFDRVDQGRRQLEVIATEGGVPRRLTAEPFNHVRPSYSRDGRWIYFGCDGTGRWEIWKMPAQGGAPQQLTRQGGGVEAFESPDGKYVYYDKAGARTLWRMPVGGGKEELAVDAPIRHGHWALLKDGLLILNPEAQPTPALERFRFASGRRETLRPLELGQITVSGFTTPAVAVSPDGRWILYVNMERNTSDLMLLENF